MGNVYKETYAMEHDNTTPQDTAYEEALIRFYAKLSAKNLAGARRRVDKTAAELGMDTVDAVEHLIKRYIEFQYSINKISGGAE